MNVKSQSFGENYIQKDINTMHFIQIQIKSNTRAKDITIQTLDQDFLSIWSEFPQLLLKLYTTATISRKIQAKTVKKW